MRSVKKTRVELFRLSFSTGKVESKKPFFDCVRKPNLGFSRKRPFSTDKSDCIRNDLRSIAFTKHQHAATQPAVQQQQQYYVV